MTQIRSESCSACPYRRDVPSGVWHESEYEKLRPYDNDTAYQPQAPFFCHATQEFLCHGWAVVGGYDLLALRILELSALEPIDIPPTRVPLFSTHAEAADHGLAEVKRPSRKARSVGDRLLRKHKRLKR